MGKTLVSSHHFERLLDLVKTLRSEHGCPWDRAQTADKIKVYLMEEAYEVLDAIDSKHPKDVCGELGDLLFHIVFLARIFEESCAFDMDDVLKDITEKMIRRHPHVFADEHVSGVTDVKKQWQEIKAQEKKEKNMALFDPVPHGLPALLRAYRLEERAARMGVGDQDLETGFETVERLYKAFKAEALQGRDKRAARRYGDLLFSMVSLGRMMAIHPENALSQAIGLFLKRCQSVEMKLQEKGQAVDALSREKLTALWQEAVMHVVPDDEEDSGPGFHPAQ